MSDWIKTKDMMGRLVRFRRDQIVGYRGGEGMPGQECTEVTTKCDPRRVVVGCTVEEFDQLMATADPAVPAISYKEFAANVDRERVVAGMPTNPDAVWVPHPTQLPSAEGHPDNRPGPSPNRDRKLLFSALDSMDIRSSVVLESIVDLAEVWAQGTRSETRLDQSLQHQFPGYSMRAEVRKVILSWAA